MRCSVRANTSSQIKLQFSVGPITASNGVSAKARVGVEEEWEEVRRALEEKTAADAVWQRAREEATKMERELKDARRARHRARGELDKALELRDHATRLLLKVTCHACSHHSLVVMSMATIDGHGASVVAREHLRLALEHGARDLRLPPFLLPYKQGVPLSSSEKATI
ncbi:hypothetical protein GUJ93_ZPchr0013g35271 [Zizania palustris]|uniref:Uncharacterized protein n=1 Tax=Zizania palustris TaxID=103762 RepID=A0A8J5WWJ3_ZIZPA|nr:hypothetical protein GUJ93_ZPchr0013g35271 [Zizania palustris]